MYTSLNKDSFNFTTPINQKLISIIMKLIKYAYLKVLFDIQVFVL